MASRTYWHREPDIFVAEYTNQVSTDDLETVMQECLKKAEKKPTYFLVDMSESTSFPTNILKLASLSQLINHPNARWFAFLNAGTFVKFVMQVLHRNSVKLFTDRQEAIDFLEEQANAERQVKSS